MVAFLVIGIPLIGVIGLTLIFLGAPLWIRLVANCSKISDPKLLHLFQECFQKAGLDTPSLWTIRSRFSGERFSRRNDFCNIMIAGLPFGRGSFQTALFITQSLVEQLPSEQLEALVLHEVAHLSLKHAPKRWVVTTLITLLAVFLFSILVYLGAQALSAPLFSNLVTVGFGVSLFAEVFLVRTLVRAQELEADRYAVKMGAKPGALALALQTVSRWNGTSMSFSGMHPSPDERISLLRVA